MSLRTIIYLLLFFGPFLLHAQSQNRKMQKAWIKISTVNLSPDPIATDTTYARYSFDENKVNISFNPASNGNSFDWQLTDNSLMVAYETYSIEELTDSTLVFSKENFRRFRFVSEVVYCKYKTPDITVRFNDQPVYVASNYLTARYKKDKSLYKVIEEELDRHYSVRHKNTFIAKFIVTAKGKIERIEVVKGISAAFDNDVVKLIGKSGGDWHPAKIDTTPVNCEMTFQLNYLDSIAPNLGIIDGKTEL